ncbi:MAG: aminomethyltransferase family protein [Clostridiales bacterium]|nr:aminomethyltransferase family protein [Clostridiales bacterium]
MYKNVYKNDAMKRSEHMAVRETAGWYLYTHQLVEVTGEDAAAFLDYMVPNNIMTLGVTRDRYTTMLNEKGQIIDDIVIMQVEEGVYWVSTLYAKRMIPWFDEHKGDRKAAYKNITAQWDMYAVQGPKSKEVLNSLLETSVDGQKFFQILDNKIGDIPVKINRGGFTGEKLGYEIYCAPENSKAVVEKLRAAEAEFGMKEVTDIQIMVWTLPTEKGFYLMCDIHWTNPLEVGLDKNINWEKEFIGKEALLKVKEEGAKRTLLGFTVDEEDIFIPAKNLGGPGTPVMYGGEEVGRVTKVTYSYCLDKNIGYALVDNSKVKIGDKVLLHNFEAVLTDKVFI